MIHYSGNNHERRIHMKTALKVGDKAVYPGHGVGKIISIEDKDVMGSRLTLYSMKIMESGTKIIIPKNKIDSSGIRPVASKKQALKVKDIICDSKEKTDKKTFTSKNWQKRHQFYTEKIKTGSIYEIAEIIRDLNHIKENKELSYGEKKIMDKVSNMLYSELSLTMEKKDLNFLSPTN